MSDRSINRIKAVATIYDKNGQFIKTAHGYADLVPLAPGKTAPFTILVVDHQNFATFTIEFDD